MSGYVRVPAISQTPISLFNATTITATSGSNLTYYQYQNSQTGDTTSVMGHDVVGVSIDEFCDEKTGDFHEHKVRIRCPHCAYPNYPFRRKQRPLCLETGEEWVGLEYKQPYAHYSTECAYCEEAYYFRLFADV